jgi:hypothetical protein
VPHSRSVDDLPVLPRRRYWLLLVLGGALILCCVLAWRAGLFGRFRPQARGDFEAAVLGLTAEEVRHKVGDPDEVLSGVSVLPEFEYRARTYDPATGKTDHSVSVIFVGDRARSFHYTP